MEEGSGDELDKPQESTIKKKLLSSARGWHWCGDKLRGLFNIQELQAHYKHLRTVREILIKEQQQTSVQTKCDGFSKSALLHSKTSTTAESSINE
jgi:hypothetical protein